MKTANINGVKIPVLNNNRSMIEFNRMTGRTDGNINGFEDALKYLYCSIKAGAISSKLEFTMDFEAFIDYTDANPDMVEGDEPESDEPVQELTGEEKKTVTG